MAKVSPVTKLAILVGVVAIPYLLWTSSSGTPTGVAGVPKDRAAQAAAPEAADDAVPKRRELPALQTFAAVVERPLFTPTRRLVRPVEAPVTEPEPQATAEDSRPRGAARDPAARPALLRHDAARQDLRGAGHARRRGGQPDPRGRRHRRRLAGGRGRPGQAGARRTRGSATRSRSSPRARAARPSRRRRPRAKGQGQAQGQGGGQPDTAGDAEGEQIPPDDSATGDDQGGGEQDDQGDQ